MQDDILNQMQQLKAQFDSGAIDGATYEARFSALNQSVGERCSRCRTGVATIRRGRRSLCAACVLRPARRVSRLSLALAIVLAIGFALVYVASL